MFEHVSYTGFCYTGDMTPEIWTTIIGIISAVIAIATFIHFSQRGLRSDLNKRIDDLARRIDEQGKEQSKFREDMAGRMGKLEGLLEGLREAITGRRSA